MGLGYGFLKLSCAMKPEKHWTGLSLTAWEMGCSALPGRLISFGIQKKGVKKHKTDQIWLTASGPGNRPAAATPTILCSHDQTQGRAATVWHTFGVCRSDRASCTSHNYSLCNLRWLCLKLGVIWDKCAAAQHPSSADMSVAASEKPP